MSKFITKIAFLFLLVLPSFLHAQNKWEYTEPVSYQENHDPGMIWLKDSRQLTIKFTNIPWEEVDKWAPGRKLFIAYNEASGTVLLDSLTQKYLPVLDGLKKLPMDILLDTCIAKAISTLDMCDCYLSFYDKWDKELNRVDSILLSVLDSEQKTKLIKSHTDWITYRESRIKAIQSIYNREGTVNRIYAAMQFYLLTKNQALELTGILEEIWY